MGNRTHMNIGIDMMGGDFAPLEAVKGLQLYLSQHPGAATVFCIGDEAQVKPLLEEYLLTGVNIQTVHAPEVIGYHEHPTKALKEKQAKQGSKENDWKTITKTHTCI